MGNSPQLHSTKTAMAKLTACILTLAVVAANAKMTMEQLEKKMSKSEKTLDDLQNRIMGSAPDYTVTLIQESASTKMEEAQKNSDVSEKLLKDVAEIGKINFLDKVTPPEAKDTKLPQAIVNLIQAEATDATPAVPAVPAAPAAPPTNPAEGLKNEFKDLLKEASAVKKDAEDLQNMAKTPYEKMTANAATMLNLIQSDQTSTVTAAADKILQMAGIPTESEQRSEATQLISASAPKSDTPSSLKNEFTMLLKEAGNIRKQAEELQNMAKTPYDTMLQKMTAQMSD